MRPSRRPGVLVERLTRRGAAAPEPTILQLYALAILGADGVVVSAEAPFFRPEDVHQAASLRLIGRYLVVPFTLRRPGAQ
jgi:hypothetical protein